MGSDDTGRRNGSADEATELEGQYRELLSCLGDDVCRTILVAAVPESLSASELADACGVSRSTVYRRLNRLVDLGLVSELPRTDANARAGSSVFRTVVDRLEVGVDADGLTIDTHAVEPASLPDVSPVDPHQRVVETEDGPVVEVQCRIPVEHAGRLFEEWGLQHSVEDSRLVHDGGDAE